MSAAGIIRRYPRSKQSVVPGDAGFDDAGRRAASYTVGRNGATNDRAVTNDTAAADIAPFEHSRLVREPDFIGVRNVCSWTCHGFLFKPHE
jgi:hypothetical protein